MESDYGRNDYNCLRGWQSVDSVQWGRRRLLELRDGFIYLFIVMIFVYVDLCSRSSISTTAFCGAERVVAEGTRESVKNN